MKTFYEKYKRDLLGFFLLFAVLVLRISWFGFEYNLQLDDYIHYRTYPEGTDFVALCIRNGHFASRPLAALMDLVFWARLPLFFSSVLLCGMYAAAGILFLRLFRRIFGTGELFLVVFALLPLGFEGTYWHAAATRILPPMLFAALALTSLDCFVRTRKWLHLPFFLVWSMLSFCFYEQMLVLSLALTLMMVLLYLLQKHAHGLWGLTVFLPVGAYVAVTGYFAGLSQGQLADRMNIILPSDPNYALYHLPSVLKQLRSCFLEGTERTLGSGLIRGLELCISEGIWAAVLIPVIGIGCWLLLRSGAGAERTKCFHLTPLFAVLAALAPITPFFIITNPWLSLRCTVPSFLGIALLADYLLRLILKNRTAAVTALLAAVCLTASVSELYDYHMVAGHNDQVARVILEKDAELDFQGTVGILGLNESYHTDQNYYYHDHVAAAHISDWALTGLLRYYEPDGMIDFKPTPLDVSQEYYWYSWSKSVKDVTAYDTLLLYDHEAGTLEPLTVTKAEGEQWLLHDAAGVLRAKVWQDDQGCGNIAIFEP